MRDVGYRTREEVDELEGALTRSRGWRERLLARRRSPPRPPSSTGIDEEVAALVEGGRRVRRGEPLARPRDGRPATSYAEPGGGPDCMRELTFTEAAREALGEEMARDPTIFVVGEGIGARGGNFNTTTGLYERYGAGAAARHADLRARLRRPLHRRGHDRHAAGRRLHVRRLRPRRARRDGQPDAKMQYMSRGRLKMPIVLRGCIGVGDSAATHHSGSYYPIFAHIPGLRVVVPTTPRRRQGPAQDGDPLRRPGPLPGAPGAAQTRKGPVPDGEHVIPFGQAAVAREGTRRHRGRHRGHGAARAGGRRRARPAKGSPSR